MNKRFAVMTAGILSGLAVAPAHAITTYDITLIGLYDAGHTQTGGYQTNTAQFLNNAGQVVGYANRYSGSTSVGRSVWLYNGSTTQEIGLTDAGHTNSSTRYQYNGASFLNNAGQVAGGAERYNGSTNTGFSAWLYNGNTTQEIGLTDAMHTRNDGVQYNNALSLNNAGQVAGGAARFNGSTDMGYSAWLYNGSTTQEIGLTDAGHTQTGGYQYNNVQMLNNAGQVAGTAQRYNGSTSTGYSAWLFNGSTTQEIGLTDAGHTQTGGYRYNVAGLLNNAGQVTGYANRYAGSTSMGRSAWLYNGTTTQEIGLTDTAHTQTGGYQTNTASFLNNAGQVAGTAQRYNGSTNTGQSAWLYNGSTTQEIGLTDTGHTENGGYQYNDALSLNNAGQVAGWAQRYNGSTFTGYSAWLYNGSTTQEIGLTDAGHTQTGGYRYNVAQFLNNAGQVAGSAQRYNGSTNTGESAWFFDLATDQTFSMDLSVSVLDGSAFSTWQYLGDDGLALGIYTLYDPTTGNALGFRAFSFMVADGFHDLGSLVDGGLNAAGWSYLATAIESNGVDQVIGNGVLAGMNGQAAYLLTPVPEPESFAMMLAGLGLVGYVVRRTKQKAV